MAKKMLFLLFGIIFTLSFSYSLEFVLPTSFDGKELRIYPGLNIEVNFLNSINNQTIILDSLDCASLKCNVFELKGPYYGFEIINPPIGKYEINISYHYKGSEQNITEKITAIVSKDFLKTYILMTNEGNLFVEKKGVISFVNNSDNVFEGYLSTNYPQNILPNINFILDGRTNKEYNFSFIPKNPGNYDIEFYLNIKNLNKELISKKTILINRNLQDFLSLPANSFFIANPIFYLYSSITYFIALLA